ncbi:MAG: hypothetical protein R3F56_22010 [Planctomycetota bacterium]
MACLSAAVIAQAGEAGGKVAEHEGARLGAAEPEAGERAAFDAALVHRWAPIHHQDVDVTGSDGCRGRADYLTAVDYDGDWDCANNWEHLPSHPLVAHVYASVVESATHWFLVYAFYHPRDWSDVPIVGALDSHENDLEGLLAIVRRPSAGTDRFGTLEAMVTVFHRDFYTFVPEGSPLRTGQETVDGNVTWCDDHGTARPMTAQQAKGHGLKAWPYVQIDGGDGIVYAPTLGRVAEPAGPNDRQAQYRLVDIFAPGGLWAHRTDPHTFASPGSFRGDNGVDNAAHAPWSWDDHDDGHRLRGGELALDPAKLASIYFRGFPAAGRVYLRNRYLDIEPRPRPTGTVEVGPYVLTWRPPHVGDGDDEFAGHGPRVEVAVRLQIAAGGRRLEAIVDMTAEEWEDGTRRSDFTTARGTSPARVLYQAPEGQRIAAILGPTSSTLRYVDHDHDLDEFRRSASELVQIYECVGDSKGRDAGRATRVTAYLNPILLRLE